MMHNTPSLLLNLIILAIVNSILLFQSNDGLVVTLNDPKSTVRGHIVKSYGGNDYYAFQDIPYARPPVGNLRFQVSRFLLHFIWKISCINDLAGSVRKMGTDQIC